MDHKIAGGFHKLIEKALRRDGTAPVKLIAPGWGSSGYYPAEVLERDGPTLFRAGTKMYWDHPTVSEEMERPEGSLRNLAAVLISDARWDGQGVEGPGLYADAKVFEVYQSAVNEMGAHIGVSIRASGRATQGEAEGRRGPIIQALTAAASVDFVTEPGAGGRILQLFEAARQSAESSTLPTDNGSLSAEESERANKLSEEETMELEAVKVKLAEALSQNEMLQADNARLRESMLLRDAQAIAGAALAEADLPDVTRQRLQRSVAQNPPVVDGKLDEAALRTRITEAVAAETAYLSEAAGWNGSVRGMGGGQAAPQDNSEQVALRMRESFARLGLSEEEIKTAVNGRIG